MNRSVLGLVVAGALLATASSGGAQERPEPHRARPVVPPGQMPPPGMCRVWLDDVPASQQPAPTDCASAVRKRPPNARIIFSPQGDGVGVKLPVKGFGAQPEPGADDEKGAPAKERGKRVKRPDKPDGGA